MLALSLALSLSRVPSFAYLFAFEKLCQVREERAAVLDLINIFRVAKANQEVEPVRGEGEGAKKNESSR